MKNVPQVTVNECAKQLELIYSKCVEKKVSFSYVLAPFLWGPPGIGKSTVVKELGEFLSKKYHKQINLLDLRLYEYNPVDLKGIPYKDETSTFTTWLMPKILDFDRSDDVINILFLDELLSAKESVQAVGLQIVLDRKIDQYVLPDNTIVIAASNRKEDRSFTSNMSMALANRFSHYDVVSNPIEWKAYAYEKHLDPRIIAFLSFHPSYLSEDVKDAGYAFSSPRSWEKVSNLICLFDDLSEIQSSIASYIGEGTAMEFVVYSKMIDQLSSFEDVIHGKGVIPKEKDCLYAMICSVAMNLLVEKVNDHELNEAYLYIQKFPIDYKLAFMVDHQPFIKVNQLRVNALAGYQKIMNDIGRYL